MKKRNKVVDFLLMAVFMVCLFGGALSTVNVKAVVGETFNAIDGAGNTIPVVIEEVIEDTYCDACFSGIYPMDTHKI